METIYMRILVFFDLPVNDKKKRKIYTQFRRFLLNDGYDMIQYSVYSRICKGLHNAQKHLARMEHHIPKEGSVRSMIVTEKQYAEMRIHVGKKTNQEEYLSSQPSLFW